ncbi:predicted protein [Thalassiosira pseudonana CCMP1335]|uniref:rRNA biogenesis protein RRP36 n=1 Tax=Thalassiosira pseudonana TaxID=35128 RepID=B5YML9_THAPS|nr:predicted protein [Thalassiosira pseudonana CCMP1335]ACI64831.1 predicted protein [Thalassiosira pseudonana CCMP1335]|eukprot:scaffold2604_cov198-Alexandrium_tamarense.AAC.20
MDPASFSDEDSSSVSRSGDGRIDQESSGRRGQQPSSRDDIIDESDGGDVNSDGSSGDEYAAKRISNFEDLPTDDSEEDSDSDDDDSDDDDDSSVEENAKGKQAIDEVNNEDVPLGERVASQAKLGRRYYTGDDDLGDKSSKYNDDGGKRQRAERKSKAIVLATQRLKDARKKNATKNKKREASDCNSDNESVEGGSNSEQPKRKKSKHAPTEMSSKRRDFFARKPDLNSSGVGISIGANRYKPRDPRMVTLSGHLDQDTFDKRYGFLDEMQDQEIETLKKRVNARQIKGRRGTRARRKLGIDGFGNLEEDKEELTRLTQERAERKRAQVTRAAKRSVKKKIRDDVASGKRGAYYPKRNELRKMEVEARFEEIRKRGGDEAVDKAIAKRRKKNVAKSHKLMPTHKV